MSFELDPFQKKAIEWIQKEHSLLISAPTGSGKTLIAESAIDHAMARGEEVIYTAPIKALSNQKFRDFRARYGDEKVGILTGDVSIRPEAPIVIMTTEIYRNSLFESLDRIQKVGWVIFDEVNYLDDPERGTVWEEAILFTPKQIRILALSATVPNVREIADWISQVHGRPIEVIEETHRPVPLDFMFQSQGRIQENIKDLRRDGYLNRDNWRLSSRERHRRFQVMRAKPNRLDHLIEYLQQKDRFPAIYFAFGRRRTETLAWDSIHFDFLNPKERSKISKTFADLLARYDLTHEKSAQDMIPLIEQGIAYHHAGMLPTLKEVIEQLFTSRLIRLIFTTETFALGINMPARTVIFDELVKFYGTGFKNLTTRDFFQMAGRAGRRGMDTRGFVLVRVQPQDIPFYEVQRILYGNPEPIQSQLNTTYATLLNLYRGLGRKLLDIYPQSFHHFQSSHKKRGEGLKLLENKLSLLKEMDYLTPEGLTSKGEFAASVFGYELLLGEMQGESMLEHLDEAGLNVLLAGLIFEPRKNDFTPKLSQKNDKLRRAAEEYSRRIHKMEYKYQIRPYTKIPHFQLAPAMEAWTHGETFHKLFRLTGADEGELVRYFRMVIQLLRELLNAPHTSPRLKETAERAWRKINRDVVDAEKQLRV